MSRIASTVEAEPSGWDLSELLEGTEDEVVAGRLAELERRVVEFERCRRRLDPAMDPAELVAILKRYEGLIEEIRVLSSHGVLWVCADTRSRQAQSHRNRLQQVLTGLHNRILFLEVWWKELDDGAAEALLPDPETGGDPRYFLSKLRLTKPYTLREKAERIINAKDANGSKFLVSLWSMLNNRLQFHLEVDGENRTLGRAEVLSYAFSPRPELRAAAYRELGRVYDREASVLGQIYIHLMHDWYAEKVQLRGYRSPIAARNVANDLPDAAVEALLLAVRENVGQFHRYFRLKARWLGEDRLHRYHLYAPLATSEWTMPYGEAVRFVLETFESFAPSFAGNARRVFTENHIDSRLQEGKWSGDFCSTVIPRLTPWVLVNYAGRPRDVLNLAHELGHAVHSMLAGARSVLTQQPSLPLGETASVFCETLISDRLLDQAASPQARRELAAVSLDTINASVLRQAYLALFELAAHEAIRDGASLDDLGEIYRRQLEEQFGTSVELTDEFRYEWLGIHQIFHSPFYCYAYSFGQLLALALYRRYREEGERFQRGYLELLARGGSARPQELLESVGVDIADPGFWQLGFQVIEDRIDELEREEG